MRLKTRARWHEIRCWECRVTWTGWLWRILTGHEVAYWGQK